MILKV